MKEFNWVSVLRLHYIYQPHKVLFFKCMHIVVIRGYVLQGAGFYTRYYVYVIQWQRALVVYMSLGQLDSWLCYLSDVSTPSDAAGCSRRPEKRYNIINVWNDKNCSFSVHSIQTMVRLKCHRPQKGLHHTTSTGPDWWSPRLSMKTSSHMLVLGNLDHFTRLLWDLWENVFKWYCQW